MVQKRNNVIKYTIFSAVIWSLLNAGLITRDALNLEKTINDLAATEARSHLKKDLANRLWATMHGGVYVPISEKTPPNPYLSQMPERDITTPSGKQLTLLNPAYMTRQMAEHFEALGNAKTHITSLKPTRQETAPDEWEKSVLHSFESGRTEVMELVNIAGQDYLRLMLPLKTEAPCLLCHAGQGYEVGDIRGGLSVSIPMAPYKNTWHKEIFNRIASFALLWALGIAGLILSLEKVVKRLRERNLAQTQLEIAKENYQSLLSNSLTGIYVSQDNKIVYANEIFARTHEFAVDDIIGMDTLSLVHPDDRPIIRQRIKDRYEGRRQPNEYQVRCITRSGAVINVQRRNILTSYNGRPAILGNEIDITEQKIAEAELKASERQLQLLTDRLLEIQEIERQQFSNQIHENYAQFLGALKMHLDSFRAYDTLLPTGAGDQLRTLLANIDEHMSELRRAVYHYGPVGLNHIGVLNVIARLCKQLQESFPHLKIDLAAAVEESDIPDLLKLIIFRIVEQSFHDMKIHHHAGAVRIGVEKSENQIAVAVRALPDSSHRGLEAAKDLLQKDLAILSLKKRVETYGGSLTCQSGGITARWPLACRFPHSQ